MKTNKAIKLKTTKVVSLRVPVSVYEKVKEQASQKNILISEELKVAMCYLYSPETIEDIVSPMKLGSLFEVLLGLKERTRKSLDRLEVFMERERKALEVLEYQVEKEMLKQGRDR